MNLNENFFHLVTSVAILIAIVTLNLAGHNAADINVTLLAILSAQLGFKFGVQTGVTRNDPKNV